MNTIEHRFHVPAISCGHCVATVIKALQPLGVRVAADTAGKQLAIEAPAEITRERLAQALRDAGYPPA